MTHILYLSSNNTCTCNIILIHNLFLSYLAMSYNNNTSWLQACLLLIYYTIQKSFVKEKQQSMEKLEKVKRRRSTELYTQWKERRSNIEKMSEHDSKEVEDNWKEQGIQLFNFMGRLWLNRHSNCTINVYKLGACCSTG